MQILQAAGFDLIGTAYPAHWAEALGDFNTRGFHESRLRSGIWWQTNPHPETGAYLFPEQTRQHLVKVFADGLVKTDVAFIDHVVVTLRDWRSFTRSFDDIHEREKSWYADKGLEFPSGGSARPIPYQWWEQNYSLVRDIATRRHQASFLTYDRTVADPAREISAVLDRLAVHDPARRAAAIACVEPSMSRPRAPHADEAQVPAEDAAAFDAFFATVNEGRAIGPELIAQMNETQERAHARFSGSESR